MSSCLSQIKWRLKPNSKRRLEIDVLALCTGMRPVVMIDYGGKLPELQDRLLSLLELIQEFCLLKMVEQSKESNLGMQLRSIQKLFSSTFPLDGSNNDAKSSLLIDLSCCLQDTKVTIPTLNGWLLDYPVVYLFATDHIEEAIYNLSTKSLRIFKVLVQRKGTTEKDSLLEELTSFSVPCELSMGGSKEVWAEAFMERMSSRWEECKHIWRSLDLQVSECYPQAIVL
uniref:Uncharacterized protein n=1 Tax=Brassica campestris TaxID=3711 RepID=M4CTB1_BRACM